MSITLCELVDLVLSDIRVRDLMARHSVDVRNYACLLNDLPDIRIETFADFQTQYDCVISEFGHRLGALERLMLVEHKPVIMALVLEVFNELV